MTAKRFLGTKLAHIGYGIKKRKTAFSANTAQVLETFFPCSACIPKRFKNVNFKEALP